MTSLGPLSESWKWTPGLLTTDQPLTPPGGQTASLAGRQANEHSKAGTPVLTAGLLSRSRVCVLWVGAGPEKG